MHLITGEYILLFFLQTNTATIGGLGRGLLYAVLAAALIAMGYGWFLVLRFLKRSSGPKKLQSRAISMRSGIHGRLMRRLKVLAKLSAVVIVAFLIFFYFLYKNIYIASGAAISFCLGVAGAFLIGYIVDKIRTRAAVRAAYSVRNNAGEALLTTLEASGAMGMFFVATAVLIVVLTLLFYGVDHLIILPGLGLGAGLAAYVMGVGGSILADSSRNLSKLIEENDTYLSKDSNNLINTTVKGINEWVGGCSGTAVNIFESFIVIVISCIILGAISINGMWFQESYKNFAPMFAARLAIYPLLVAAAGLISSVIGILSLQKVDFSKNYFASLRRGFWIVQAVSLLLIFLISAFFLVDPTRDSPDYRFFLSTAIGLFWGISILFISGFAYSRTGQSASIQGNRKPTRSHLHFPSQLARGMRSSFWFALILAFSLITVMLIFRDNMTFAIYGAGLMGLGLLPTAGYLLALECSSIIPESAGVIFDISDLPETSENILANLAINRLQTVGRTVRNFVRIYTITCAVAAAISLFSLFISQSRILPSSMKVAEGKLILGGEAINFTDFNFLDILSALGIQINMPHIFLGLLAGGAIPFLFVSMVIGSSVKLSHFMTNVIHEQLETKASPKSSQEAIQNLCVEKFSSFTWKELLAPGIVVIASPVAIGFGLGPSSLGAFLAGLIIVSFLLLAFFSFMRNTREEEKVELEQKITEEEAKKPALQSLLVSSCSLPTDSIVQSLSFLMLFVGLIALLIAPAIVRLIGTPVLSRLGDQNWSVRIPIVLIAVVAMCIAFIVSSIKPAPEISPAENKISTDGSERNQSGEEDSNKSRENKGDDSSQS